MAEYKYSKCTFGQKEKKKNPGVNVNSVQDSNLALSNFFFSLVLFLLLLMQANNNNNTTQHVSMGHTDAKNIYIKHSKLQLNLDDTHTQGTWVKVGGKVAQAGVS